VVFLPPTLTASIDGMTVAPMPDLAGPTGRPAPRPPMVISAILPERIGECRRLRTGVQPRLASTAT
jgi:Mg2+ and Co2+ transporter CorA